MKRIIVFSLCIAISLVFLASCSKRDHYNNNREEYATAVDYQEGYPYTIIQFDQDRTYAVIESLESSSTYWPEQYDRMKGYFDIGHQRIYNVTGQFYMDVQVHEYANSLSEAQAIMDDYIYRYGAANKPLIQRSGKRAIEVK